MREEKIVIGVGVMLHGLSRRAFEACRPVLPGEAAMKGVWGGREVWDRLFPLSTDKEG